MRVQEHKKSNPRQNKVGAFGDDAGRGKLCKKNQLKKVMQKDCSFSELNEI